MEVFVLTALTSLKGALPRPPHPARTVPRPAPRSTPFTAPHTPSLSPAAESTSWFGTDKNFVQEVDKTIGAWQGPAGGRARLGPLRRRAARRILAHPALLTPHPLGNAPLPHPRRADLIQRHGLEAGHKAKEVGGADQYFRCFGMATENKSSAKVRAMALDGIERMIGACTGERRALPCVYAPAHPRAPPRAPARPARAPLTRPPPPPPLCPSPARLRARSPQVPHWRAAH